MLTSKGWNQQDIAQAGMLYGAVLIPIITISALMNSQFDIRQIGGCAILAVLPWIVAFATRHKQRLGCSLATGVVSLMNPLVIRYPTAQLLCTAMVATAVFTVLTITIRPTVVDGTKYEEKVETQIVSESAGHASETDATRIAKRMALVALVLPFGTALVDQSMIYAFIVTLFVTPALLVAAAIIGATATASDRQAAKRKDHQNGKV